MAKLVSPGGVYSKSLYLPWTLKEAFYISSQRAKPRSLSITYGAFPEKSHMSPRLKAGDMVNFRCIKMLGDSKGFGPSVFC